MSARWTKLRVAAIDAVVAGKVSMGDGDEWHAPQLGTTKAQVARAINWLWDEGYAAPKPGERLMVLTKAGRIAAERFGLEVADAGR